MKKVCLIGSGAWGTAVATVLAHNGHEVIMWCYEQDVARDINTNHLNSKYLPDVSLHANIKATTDLGHAMAGSRWLFEATPVKYLHDTLRAARQHYHKEQVFVVLSKGIERDSALLPTQMLDEIFETNVAKAVCVGPSFAHEVAEQKVTGLLIASDNHEIAEDAKKLLENDYFFPETSSDMIGAQLCAAFKNIMALGAGLLDGAGYADNTKALFITRGLAEIVQIAETMGAQEKTVYGLAGLGDLILTTGSTQSRNFSIGKLVGSGQSLDEALKSTGFTAEGVNTLQSVQMLAKKLNVALPLCSAIYAVLFEEASVRDLVQSMK